VRLKEQRGVGRQQALEKMFAELKAKATKYLQRLDLCHMVKHLQKHFGRDEIVGLIKTHDESQKHHFLG